MPKGSSLTPIRRQYLQIKRQYPDAILFFRLGDFYESFDQDAQIASRELDIVLTSRNIAKGQRVPMAGVPYHAVEGYIAKLIAKGYKVAICEQVAKEPIKGLMPREVVRVVTPGTVVEPVLLAEKRNSYLATVVLGDRALGVAYVDITTGEFATTQFAASDPGYAALRELDRLAPAEVVLSDDGNPFLEQGQAQTAEAISRHPELASLACPLTLYDDWRFELGNCRQALLEHFSVSSLAGYGCENLPLAIRAAGVLLQYLRQNQSSALAQLTHLATYSSDSFMTLDVATRRNLELTETIRDRSFRGSLLWVLDATLTPMGGRMLRRWLGQPLLELAPLLNRQRGVEVCFRDMLGRTRLCELLKGFGDLERLTNRVVQGIATPRDLIALKSALDRTGYVQQQAAALTANTSVEGWHQVYPLDGASLAPPLEAADLIQRAVVEEPPAGLAKGGFIRPCYSQELDAIEASVAEAKQWVADLEHLERERTGIKNLKVGYNRVFGYYLEVTKANTEAVPETYIRKQTLVNAERYITPELKERESLILNAAERTQELENALFADLLRQLAVWSETFLEIAKAIAHLDVYAGLAEVATVNNYVCPELSDEPALEITAGRHPVVERTLPDERFVPNDTSLSSGEAIHIITGPNMSGKSTYLRQVALIVLLAQMGSFVPADAARIGLVDRIFARVGARDEITAGYSTFMVEMVELANILNHATPRSLLILDEIGRGTSTYDGISIAWSAVEYIHNHPRLGAKTLFATHYHELTELVSFLPHVRNYNVAVTHQGDQVIFTHHIVEGGADRSYGIHVAQMAGMPAPVTHRAEEILDDLESDAPQTPPGSGRRVIQVRQLSMFEGEHPLVDKLRQLDINAMSPLEALNTLYRLQQEIDGH